MHQSKRLGAIVVALCAAVLSLVTQSQFAGAQAAEKVQPMFAVQTSGSSGVVGFIPAQIRKAYGFDQIANGGKGQTIGIVNSFDHPAIEQDLAVFSNTFGLPSCTTQNKCFRKVYASGTKPPTNELWALEIALDVEWAHAIAPEAKILLVEAADDQLATLMQAVDVAVKEGASVVSMSWGLLNEIPNEVTYDSHLIGSGVSFFASSGDLGHGTTYPAASPYVTSVGGTNLKIKKDVYSGETAWSGSGGGLSEFEPAPIHQITFPIPNNPLLKRGMPDVAYDGDPASGVAVYDSIPVFGSSGWFELGGTSVGAPQWAALFAIANSLRAQARPPKGPLTGRQGVLYDIAKENYAANFNDIVKGKNDNCGVLCTAAPGYDYITGLGTPRVQFLIPALQNK